MTDHIVYRLTSSINSVQRMPDTAFVAMDAPEYVEWLAAGNTPLPMPLPYELYSPEHFLAIRTAAWEWMLGVVKARRYDSIETCVSYYNSGVERYRKEAKAMSEWRDDVNLALEALVVQLPAGIETWEQVRPMLPQPEAYDWPAPVDLPLEGVPPIQLEP